MMSTDNAPVPGTSQPVSMADYSGELLPYEFFWRDHQQWLEEKGYMLRPRYRPGWVPSWQGTDAFYWRFEDGISINVRISPCLGAVQQIDVISFSSLNLWTLNVCRMARQWL